MPVRRVNKNLFIINYSKQIIKVDINTNMSILRHIFKKYKGYYYKKEGHLMKRLQKKFTPHGPNRIAHRGPIFRNPSVVQRLRKLREGSKVALILLPYNIS